MGGLVVAVICVALGILLRNNSLLAAAASAGLVGVLALSYIVWRLSRGPVDHTAYVVRLDKTVLASCKCGWFGEFYESAEPAFQEARSHSAKVEDEIYIAED